MASLTKASRFVYAYSSWNGLVARHCERGNTKRFLEMKFVPALTLALKQGRWGVGGVGQDHVHHHFV